MNEHGDASADQDSPQAGQPLTGEIRISKSPRQVSGLLLLFVLRPVRTRGKQHSRGALCTLRIPPMESSADLDDRREEQRDDAVLFSPLFFFQRATSKPPNSERIWQWDKTRQGETRR